MRPCDALVPFRCLSVVVLLFLTIPAGADTIYVVKRNDTLLGIAKKFQVTADELVDLNNLSTRIVRAGQKLKLPTEAEESNRYVVHPGDRLMQIAHDQNVSYSALKDINGIENPEKIVPGQVLILPRSGIGSSSKTSRLQLEASMKRTLDEIPVTVSRWKYIVIHHTATSQGNATGIDRDHRERGMENGLAYHFVIGNGHGMNDGSIFIGNRWLHQLNGGHLHSEELNAESIGICLVGNCEKNPPTEAQMKSLEKLTNYLLRRCDLTKTAVKTHHEINTRPT